METKEGSPPTKTKEGRRLVARQAEPIARARWLEALDGSLRNLAYEIKEGLPSAARQQEPIPKSDGWSLMQPGDGTCAAP